MIHYKWEILQAKLFYATRDRDGEIKKRLEIKMCGNDNYCEIVCQLFQASLLLMDSAVVCCETSIVLIHIQEGSFLGGGRFLP